MFMLQETPSDAGQVKEEEETLTSADGR